MEDRARGAELAKAGDGTAAQVLPPSCLERDESKLSCLGDVAKVRGGIQASDSNVILFSSLPYSYLPTLES
jgi:hypothetical protein